MIRFVNLTEAYWGDSVEGDAPLCAFLDTVNDSFLKSVDGGHVFNDRAEVAEHADGKRLLRLVPDGFFGAGNGE